MIARLIGLLRRSQPDLADSINLDKPLDTASKEDSINRNFSKIINDFVSKNIDSIFIQRFDEYGAIRYKSDVGYLLYNKYGLDFISSLIDHIRVITDQFRKNISFETELGIIVIKVLVVSHDVEPKEIQLKLIAQSMSRQPLPMERLGFSQKEVDSLVSNAILPGITFIAGPPSSGRSTTLYYLLHVLQGERNDIRLVHIDKYSKFEFPDVTTINEYNEYTLDNILNSYPDVISFVNVCTHEELKFIHKASMMGIRVIATIQGVSPISIFYSMTELGLSQHQIMAQDFIKTIVFQGLSRRLCHSCATLLEDADHVEKVHNPNGCSECNKTGWLGQVLLAEIIHYPHVQKLFANTLNKEGMGINHNFSSEHDSILKDKAIQALRNGWCDRKQLSWQFNIDK